MHEMRGECLCKNAMHEKLPVLLDSKKKIVVFYGSKKTFAMLG